MQRYNQGFLKFGPLEKANDGDLVKYEDIVSVFDSYEQEISDLIAENHKLNIDLENKYETLTWMGMRVQVARREHANCEIAYAKLESKLRNHYNDRLLAMITVCFGIIAYAIFA